MQNVKIKMQNDSVKFQNEQWELII